MILDICESRAKIDEHFTGALRTADERSMRAHLLTCDRCRTYYRRRVLLAKLDPTADSPEARILRGLHLAPEEKRSARRWIHGSTVAIVLAAAAIVLLFVRQKPIDEGFAARGGPTNIPIRVEADRSFVEVYRVSKGSEARLAVDVLRRDDELAFSYVNAAKSKRLMILGIDESHRVYWFFPAWTNEAEDPVAIPIESTSDARELREAIGHHFEGSRLEIHAFFLDEPLTVRQMEKMISGGFSSIPNSQHFVRSFSFVP